MHSNQVHVSRQYATIFLIFYQHVLASKEALLDGCYGIKTFLWVFMQNLISISRLVEAVNALLSAHPIDGAGVLAWLEAADLEVQQKGGDITEVLVFWSVAPNLSVCFDDESRLQVSC